MRFKELFLSVTMMSLLSVAIGCGSGGGGGDSSSGGSSGTLSLSLQDVFSERYKGIYVTITEVQVHLGKDENDNSNWRVVASPGKTYNLLDLVNGVREQLGIAELEAGSYTQMRLIIGRTPDNGINLLSRPHPFANYVIINNPGNEVHELKVPSGFQTGIKIVHGFVIQGNMTTELILDFDASKSVVQAGASGLWLLKPTIQVLTDSYSIVRGIVEAREVAAPTGSPLQGALVNSQQTPSGDPQVIASTITGEDGKYALFIHPGVYNIVGSKIGPETDPDTGRTLGYDPVCIQITTRAGDTVLGADLVLLGPKETGTVTGRVFISDGASEQFVTLSFRKTVKCKDSPEETVIEIKSVNLADGVPYSEELTPGIYTVHASTANHPAKSAEVTVEAGKVQGLDDFVL